VTFIVSPIKVEFLTKRRNVRTRFIVSRRYLSGANVLKEKQKQQDSETRKGALICSQRIKNTSKRPVEKNEWVERK